MLTDNDSSSRRSAPSGDDREKKYQNRLARNRVAAQKSRTRKKEALDALQAEVHSSNQRNLELTGQVGELEAKAEALTAQLREKDEIIQTLREAIRSLTASQQVQAALPAPMQTAVSADAGITRSWEGFQRERPNQASPAVQQQEPPQDNGLPVLDFGDISRPKEDDGFMEFVDVDSAFDAAFGGPGLG